MNRKLLRNILSEMREESKSLDLFNGEEVGEPLIRGMQVMQWADRIEAALKLECEPLTTGQFNDLLHMAVDKVNRSPKEIYVELTWWDNVFKPLIAFDCDNDEDSAILVFDKISVNTFNCGTTIPSEFYINSDASSSDTVVHYPMTVGNLIDNAWMREYETIKFLLCDSPVNSELEINPFRTTVYINPNDEAVLALYVDDRDSGEWMPFSKMTPDWIKVIDRR